MKKEEKKTNHMIHTITDDNTSNKDNTKEEYIEPEDLTHDFENTCVFNDI